jgi:hypothetical protein
MNSSSLEIKNSIMGIQSTLDEVKHQLTDDSYLRLSNELRDTFEKIKEIDISKLYKIKYLEHSFDRQLNTCNGNYNIKINYNIKEDIVNSEIMLSDLKAFIDNNNYYKKNVSFFFKNNKSNRFKSLDIKQSLKHENIIQNNRCNIIIDYNLIILLSIERIIDIAEINKFIEEREDTDNDDDSDDDDISIHD